jgi:peroxiredoxin
MNRRNLLQAAMLGSALLTPHHASQAAPRQSAAVLTGTTIDGQPYQLKNDAGKVVLVFFWSTECAVCRDKMPELRSNYEGWIDKGFQLVAVSLDKKMADAVAYQRIIDGTVNKSKRFVSLWRGAANHSDSFGKIIQTPTSFILDRQHRVANEVRGRIAPTLWDDVAELVLG